MRQPLPLALGTKQALDGHPQSIYPLPRSPLVSQLASMSVDTILRHCDSDSDGSFSTLNIKLDRLLSSEELSMSLCESRDPSRHYYIQGTVPSIRHVPLLWLPVDTAYIFSEEFCKKVKGEARLNFSTRGGRGKVASEKENVAENYYMRKFSRVGWVPKILARFWKRCRMA